MSEKHAIKLEKVVKILADGYIWNWTEMVSCRNAADGVLRLLAYEGLIDGRRHPSGGLVWRVNGKLFGRTDSITHKNFTELRKVERNG